MVPIYAVPTRDHVLKHMSSIFPLDEAQTFGAAEKLRDWECPPLVDPSWTALHNLCVPRVPADIRLLLALSSVKIVQEGDGPGFSASSLAILRPTERSRRSYA
jgi:hypothetical protein